MRNHFREALRALWVAMLFVLGAGIAIAMPNQRSTNAAPGGMFPFISAGANSATPQQLALQKLDLAEWLRQQVAARKAAAAVPPLDAKSEARQKAISQLEASTGSKVKVTFRRNGTPSEIKGPVLHREFSGAVSAPAERPAETARNFLRANRELLVSDDPDKEWSLRRSERDDLGRQHLRFRQEYKGLPVWPCELIVHLDKDGNMDLMDGAFISTPRGLGTKPSVPAEQAVQRARSEVARGLPSGNTEAELIIYGPLDAPARLAWKFDLSAGLSDAWRCVVDALDGSVLAAFSLVNEGAVTGSGVDGLGLTRTLHLWQQAAPFYMVDTSKTMYDGTSTPPNPDTTRGAIFIWDSQNQPPTNNPSTLGNPFLSASTSATSGWVPDAVGAAYGLSETYDYYFSRHGRNSLNGVGGSITAFVRVGINFRNAFWTDQLKVMIFGDTLPNGLDVCAHELTHGVIFSIGDGGILNYHDQPGSLNESFADIFGENVEARSQGTNDWLMGKDTILGALRNMANPGSLSFNGNPYPAKMSQYYPFPNDSAHDHGGVHENSSIFNHCYYLLAGGLNGAIGITNAEKIFYRAMTLHLSKESQFIDARHACIASAEEIFGANSPQALKTAQAFDAVEIVDAPSTPPPSPVPTVPAADSTLFLRWDPFANGFLGAYELFRRETAKGDLSSGNMIDTLKYLAQEKPAVSGDGSFVFYVTADNDYGAVNTDGTSPALGGFPGTAHSLAMTPDAQRFAFVLLDASGQPTNMITIFDLVNSTSKSIKLYGIDSEGNKLDIVKYADVLDFTTDGRTLIYDAYSETRTANSNILSGWTIYTLDLATTNITALINLNAGFDSGNPSLGKTKNNLLTFEVVNKQTGISTVLAADLFTGSMGVVGRPGVSGAFAKPDYTGDDRAIVYSQYDFFTSTLYDLVAQPLAADGVTTNGAPLFWLSDADVVAMYRRGTFVASNALPSVTLTNPVNGQVFAPAGNITLQASASDPGGSVAKVEFYQGSTKLGEKLTAPYSLIWSNVPAGKFRLSARAIDNLGGATDSSQVAITVAGRPRLTNSVKVSAGLFQFTLLGDAGVTYVVQQSTNLVDWAMLTVVTNVTGTISVQDPIVAGPRRFYRALLQ